MARLPVRRLIPDNGLGVTRLDPIIDIEISVSVPIFRNEEFRDRFLGIVVNLERYIVVVPPNNWREKRDDDECAGEQSEPSETLLKFHKAILFLVNPGLRGGI